MYHTFLIHLSADGHLGYFHVLAIPSAVMILGYMCLFQFWFLQCVCPAVGLLGTLLLLLFVYALAFWPRGYGILGSPPGTEHKPPALEDKDLRTGLPQKSLYLFFMSLKLLFIL